MKELSKALVAFRSACPPIGFDSTNPHFKSRFASLAKIHKVIDPILSENGLAVMQFPISEDGRAGCVTRVMHVSGEVVEYPFTVPLSKHDPQGACAAVTYARRYGLSGALGLVTEEDDDGNSASEPVRNAGKKPAPKKSSSPRMAQVNREKIKYAARERAKELSDESINETEIIKSVSAALGYASPIEMTDDDFERAFVAVQEFEPGGAA